MNNYRAYNLWKFMNLFGAQARQLFSVRIYFHAGLLKNYRCRKWLLVKQKRVETCCWGCINTLKWHLRRITDKAARAPQLLRTSLLCCSTSAVTVFTEAVKLLQSFIRIKSFIILIVQDCNWSIWLETTVLPVYRMNIKQITAGSYYT